MHCHPDLTEQARCSTQVGDRQGDSWRFAESEDFAQSALQQILMMNPETF